MDLQATIFRGLWASSMASLCTVAARIGQTVRGFSLHKAGNMIADADARQSRLLCLSVYIGRKMTSSGVRQLLLGLQ